MANYNVALILKNPLNDSEFLLVKQTPPPKFNDEEYDSYVDSDLWDLPAIKLNHIQGEKSEPTISIQGSEKINLGKFDIESALNQILEQLGFGVRDGGEWKLWKCVEEPEFGPGLTIHTVYIMGKLLDGNQILQEGCKWMSTQSCINCLAEVKPSTDRVGPLVVIGLLNDLVQWRKWKVLPTLSYQEYPPGVILVPMQSRTAKPFLTTNLIVFAPDSVSDDCGNHRFVAQGEALIVDPGCRSEFHEELLKVVASLPRKLIVFVTHHHRDHVDGLSIIQKCNPDAILLAHENTMRRIGKDDWSLGYTSVSGSEDICVGGQRLTVVFSPGHTDGHVALLHASTNSLIVGDHCVGQGSAVLDITAGGNMTDYFQSTYKFLELSPHALIPMHGRVNLWPKHMLCGYLKNRRAREAAILQAIENGVETLFDIVANVYSEVPRSFWIPAASNVRLHVDHLADQNKLPKEFSILKFRKTCGLHFLLRWAWTYLRFQVRYQKLSMSKLLIGGAAVAGFAVFFSIRNKLISQ
ncbi:Lactamase B domain-containing protein [Citrus sinensis]|uniref:Lactamase B domain-containing protein n=1 Tax=Citrus sinensis TaxID=2711 RepID=A0ACB8NAF5_CITSI|nr:Lactamase B domain-containing protein [Citrus sinensis]